MKDRFVTRRDFLRATAAIGLGITGGSFLAACGPSPTGATGSSGGDAVAAEVVEVRVQTPGLPQLEATTKYAIEQFNQEQSAIQAIGETIPYDDIAKKTEVGFASGTLQDVNYGHNKWYKFNAYRGVYLAVDELVDSDPPEDFEDFFAQGIEGLRWEGTLYCLPDIIKPGPISTLYWNKTLLEEAGVDEPTEEWTMLDLEQAARAVADPDAGIFGVEFPFDSDLHRLACITRAFGEPTLDDQSGWPIDAEGRQFRLLEPTVSDTMQWIVSMINDRVMPRGGDDIEGGLFAAGKLAFEIQHIGMGVNYTEIVGDRFEYGSMMQPQGPEGRRGSCLEGNQWMINSQSAHVDEAWQMLKRLTNKDTNIWGSTNTVKIPARRSAYLDEGVNEKVPLYAQAVPIMDEWLEPFPMVWNLRYNEVFQIYQQEIAFVVEGEKSWDEYANTIYKKVQEIVDQDRPNPAV